MSIVRALAQARTLPERPVTVVAMVLLLLGAMLQAFLVQPAEERLRLLEQRLAQQSRPSAVTLAGASANSTPAEKLGAFYAFFDRKLRFSDWLARFYDVADRAGVEVQRAEYRRADSEGETLARYEVAIPITGDYGRIRSFAEGVLNNIPVASLDQVTFHRQRSDQAQVDADLRFTLYLRASPR